MQRSREIAAVERPERAAVHTADVARISAAALAAALDTLDVSFVQSYGDSTPLEMPEPTDLLAGLAMCDEARLRMSLIPLLLCHPNFAQYAHTAVEKLPESARFAFMCTYSAACFLQRKYRSRLAALLLDADPLPDLFTAVLGLPAISDPDVALRMVADRHCALSGKAINWLGSYEHAAVRWIIHMEKRQAWAACATI